MNSEELKKQAWKIINEAKTKTTADEQQAADQIIAKIPELIRHSISKKLTLATVMYLDEAPKLIGLGYLPYAGKIIRSHARNNPADPFNFEDIFGTISPSLKQEYELTGVAKIVFDACQKAELNPYVAQTPDKTKWGIGIAW